MDPEKSSVIMDEETKRFLCEKGNESGRILLNGGIYDIKKTAGTGFKGVVWHVVDKFGRERACKLTISEDYADRSYISEVSHAAQLERYELFTHVLDAGIVEVDTLSGPQKFVCFLEDWVEGSTLEKLLQDPNTSIGVEFFCAYTRAFAEALNIMRTCNLRHDDLHAGNVMISNPSPGKFEKQSSIKIIDLGSMKQFSVPTKKPKDDQRHFVDHLTGIWNRVKARSMLTTYDKRFLQESVKVIQNMLEDDHAIGLRDPNRIWEEIENVRSRSHFPPSKPPEVKLTRPFEFISAEHIADDRLLVTLFAKSVPWLEKVAGPDPCFITGPRGCGKSTIFRWLSLKAHLHKPWSDVYEIPIHGFYISCSSDLQNRLGWITEVIATKVSSEITHYFNMLATREVLITLALIEAKADSSGPELSSSFSKSVQQFFARYIDTAKAPGLKHGSIFVRLRELVEDDMFKTHEQILRNTRHEKPTPLTFLGDLTTLLVTECDFFQQKKIAFLIDDYSIHRLPEAVQSVLNRVFWERRPSHVFKLSSEKYGAQPTDMSGATADSTREYKEIDLGREYLALDDSDQQDQALRFATELLDNRLNSAGYSGSAQELIGSSEWIEGSLGKAILDDKREGRSNSYYHGLDCVARVCSGDISTLLLIYSEIFEGGGVQRTSRERVAKHIQHRAIVKTSRNFLEHVKTYHPHGIKMHAVLDAFGNFVRRVLTEGKTQYQNKRVVPTQCPRIEIDRSGPGIDEILDPEQFDLARELVRRAIFIEMEPGLSRHRSLTTLRWQIRRTYLPAFGAALSKNNAIKKNPDWFKYFLTSPSRACDMAFAVFQEPQSTQLDLLKS